MRWEISTRLKIYPVSDAIKSPSVRTNSQIACGTIQGPNLAALGPLGLAGTPPRLRGHPAGDTLRTALGRKIGQA